MAIESSVLNVEGMSCQHCVMSVEKAVGALNGVKKVAVDLKAKQVRVEYDPRQVSLEKIKATIDDQGYEVK